MRNYYTLDGLPLNDPALRWGLEKGTGLRIIPARKSSGATLPGRDGVLPSLGSSFEPGAVGISIAVLGDDYESMLGSVELLSGVVGQRHKLLSLVHDHGNGQKREALVEITASSEPELVAHRTAIIDVQCSVPGVFWRDQATTDSAANITATSATTVLTGLAGTTGPVPDALIQLKGGFSQATITDPVSGDSLTVNGPVAATEYVVVDAANWVARKHTTNSWSTTAGANWITNVVSNRGSGPMMALNPDFSTGAGRVQLQVKGTGVSGAPSVTVRAKRSFL